MSENVMSSVEVLDKYLDGAFLYDYINHFNRNNDPDINACKPPVPKKDLLYKAFHVGGADWESPIAFPTSNPWKVRNVRFYTENEMNGQKLVDIFNTFHELIQITKRPVMYMARGIILDENFNPFFIIKVRGKLVPNNELLTIFKNVIDYDENRPGKMKYVVEIDPPAIKKFLGYKSMPDNLKDLVANIIRGARALEETGSDRAILRNNPTFSWIPSLPDITSDEEEEAVKRALFEEIDWIDIHNGMNLLNI
jgi:hypothetical protein